MTYTCSQCGKVHEDWPALAWNKPLFYTMLTDEEKEQIATIDDDCCVIKHPEQTDRFIRVAMHQKVIGSCEPLDYGLWVSLSEENFRDYIENFDNDEHTDSYFAWFYLHIPPYEAANIPCAVHTQINGLRPILEPDPEFDHPFVKDFYEGISLQEANRRVQEVLKNGG